jgi:4'-phosphopantetheinyl transferase EntD
MMWSQHMVSIEAVEIIAHTLPASSWLSAEELQRYSEFGNRRAALAWLGGRWCAKQLLRCPLGLAKSHLSRIHIQTRNGRQQGVRPWVFLDGRLQSTRISLAHSTRLATAVLSGEGNRGIGVDLSDLDSNELPVRPFWFTDEETAWCDDGIVPRVIWSLKEALYKATNLGEPFRPRGVDVSQWLSQQSCRQIGQASGTMPSSRPGATIAWRSIGASLSLVVSIDKALRPDFTTLAKRNSYAFVSQPKDRQHAAISTR